MAKRVSPLLRLGRLSEMAPFGFNERSSRVAPPIPPTLFETAVLRLKNVLGEGDWDGYGGSSAPELGMTPVAPGFGFSTASAEKVWAEAQLIATQDPKEVVTAIVTRAMDVAKVPITELTPEDLKMLEMAVTWFVAGKAPGMEAPTPPFGGNYVADAPGRKV